MTASENLLPCTSFAFLWNLSSDIAELGERVGRIEGLIAGCVSS